MLRISRPCYDKMHRCPGWAGGGMRFAKYDLCPGGGYITYLTTEPGGEVIKSHWKWRVNQCPKCSVYVLPYVIRYVDLRWWRWEVHRWCDNVAYWLWLKTRWPGR